MACVISISEIKNPRLECWPQNIPSNFQTMGDVCTVIIPCNMCGTRSIQRPVTKTISFETLHLKSHLNFQAVHGDVAMAIIGALGAIASESLHACIVG